MAKLKYWEHFSHDADMGIRGIGPTLEAAFEMGAMALTNIVTDTNKIHPKEKVQVQCQAPDLELLFFDWINAIIYAMETRSMLFSEFNITIQDLTLKAIIKGEPLIKARHQPVVDVKGATFTELRVYQKGQKWIAQSVIDV